MNGILHGSKIRTAALILGIILSFVVMVLSVVLGYTDTSLSMAIEAYTAFNGSNEHLIIQLSRVPRALVGMAVGISLGIAGVLMQALTRNPIASPDIFGVNAGAGFFIVFGVTFLGITSIQQFMWIGFLGAAVASGLAYALGSAGRGGLTPVKLTLAGAVMAALFSSLTQGMLVTNEKALDEVLFWLAGSVEGRKLSMLAAVMPALLLAWIVSLLLSRQLNAFALGEDVAVSLGQKTVIFKFVAALMVVLLAGGSVAIAGPISFIGIVVPHFARYLVGSDHRWIVPFSALTGGIMLVLADIGARYIIMPEEAPVGVVTALLGTPFFIYIVRKGIFQR
ncbi:FecCD family ABC transporter permease [Fictibacillus sp. BK138]|uniref:FecCD family ABC transporter permease n=1 Tax=Fictibacillus sp. BK138 TaxID=2512121 RepID=UPI0010292838|nr:iron ABC transporter permease [Fictibacillus sp. BK138]RZT23314.1 iron complex transport system permease protein [Fictibacillus sp. BK138]